jgi:hypothetical protein
VSDKPGKTNKDIVPTPNLFSWFFKGLARVIMVNILPFALIMFKIPLVSQTVLFLCWGGFACVMSAVWWMAYSSAPSSNYASSEEVNSRIVAIVLIIVQWIMIGGVWAIHWSSV